MLSWYVGQASLGIHSFLSPQPLEFWGYWRELSLSTVFISKPILHSIVSIRSVSIVTKKARGEPPLSGTINVFQCYLFMPLFTLLSHCPSSFTELAHPDVSTLIPLRSLQAYPHFLSDSSPTGAGSWIFYSSDHSVFIFPGLISLFWRLLWVVIYRLHNSPTFVTHVDSHM